MTHKRLTVPSSGAADKTYGVDWNKLVDHLERNATITDPFTLNVNEHTIKHSTTNSAGDLLVSTGTKFDRKAKGTANQVLAVNSGGTDIAWTTLAAGSGDITAGANVGSGTGQVFRDKTTTILNFKTLLAGTNVTLTNNANDITIAATGGGGGGDVATTQTNTFGDFDQVFRSGRLDLRNPANTFSYSITGAAIAADRALTLPLLTAGDTVVAEAFTQTLTNKTVNATNNTITDTSTAAGDIMASNGTKFVRKARGTSLQVLRTNSAGTDIEYASLDSERVGKSQANGNASTTIFNIAHGLGSNPTYAFVNCSSQTIDFTYTTDATNIVVTFATAPASGTNNVVMYWRVVA